MNAEVSFMQTKWLPAITGLVIAFFDPGALGAATTLVGWSDSGLHEIDGSDVAVYALAPPFNTIHAQLIAGGLLVKDPAGIQVTYQAVADAAGSINTTSQGKGNFYQYAQMLFGQALTLDQGLAGFGMPGTNNQPQAMTFDSSQNCFTAQGIPITPYDDQGHKNYYPLMRLIARDSASNVLATTDIALPVSDEMDCRACHASGSQLSARPPSGWAWQTDPQKDYKLNVLQSHDDHFLGTTKYDEVLKAVGYNPAGLVATVRAGHPVLCVRCHSSAALPNTGAPNMRPLTQLMHTKHAYVPDPQSGQPLTSLTNSSSCLLCHAGPETRLMRGVHHNTINTDGSVAMQCQSCHGSISTVGAAGRLGWLDEPSCQSCHTGTAVANSGATRFTSVFDATGQPRLPTDLTYATQTNTPGAGLELFRSSQGHGGLNCAACHGAAHAEWLTSQANDNVQSAQLQNPAGGGVLTDCAACHPTTPSPRTGGPHGMHPVDSSWANNHEQDNRIQCQACHGADYRGTELSWAQGIRSYGSIGEQFWHGFQVGCYNCHSGPNGGDTGGVRAPSVSNLSASTVAGSSVMIGLQGTDPLGSPLSFRVVSQPSHGTVGVDVNNATCFPEAAFVGNDSFTYAAWDGSTDSKLGTVALTVTSGQCLLVANALAPTAAFPDTSVPFRAVASLTQCASSVTFDWDFGDGTPHGSGTNVAHQYSSAADYNWKLTVTANGANQTIAGVVTISPTLGPPIFLTQTGSDFMVTLSWPVDPVPTSLETAFDLTQPYAWQPDVVDPVYSDGVNYTVQVFFLPGQQFFRVRRLP